MTRRRKPGVATVYNFIRKAMKRIVTIPDEEYYG